MKKEITYAPGKNKITLCEKLNTHRPYDSSYLYTGSSVYSLTLQPSPYILHKSGYLSVCLCSGDEKGYGKLYRISIIRNGWSSGILRIYRRTWKTGIIAGFCVDKGYGKLAWAVPGMAAGTIVCYLFGTLWLCMQANLTFSAGLAAGVIPYLPGDIAKIILASLVGPALRKGVQRLQ